MRRLFYKIIGVNSDDPHPHYFRVASWIAIIMFAGIVIYRICKPFKFQEKKAEEVQVKGVTVNSGTVKFVNQPRNYAAITYRAGADQFFFTTKDGEQVKIGVDGRVSWTKTPDAAARTFWNAVVLAYPEFKQKIIEDYEKEKAHE